MPMFDFLNRARQDKVVPLLMRIVTRATSQSILTLGPRLETRSTLCVVALVVPVADNWPQLDDAFPAITKDFCSKGVSLVVRRPFNSQEVLVGLNDETGLTFLRGQVIHVQPLPAGFSQVGITLDEVVDRDDYPGLSALSL